MEKELDELFKKILYLDENYNIDDSLAPGDIIEWDSLSHMNLLYEISNIYGLKISFKDLNKIENWGQLKKYVIENVKEKN